MGPINTFIEDVKESYSHFPKNLKGVYKGLSRGMDGIKSLSFQFAAARTALQTVGGLAFVGSAFAFKAALFSSTLSGGLGFVALGALCLMAGHDLSEIAANIGSTSVPPTRHSDASWITQRLQEAANEVNSFVEKAVGFKPRMSEAKAIVERGTFPTPTDAVVIKFYKPINQIADNTYFEAGTDKLHCIMLKHDVYNTVANGVISGVNTIYGIYSSLANRVSQSV
ncbi:MAG: hypothetical protein WC222_04295 [Parachlamydiales bacterium]|jgi:hypothetical protein